MADTHTFVRRVEFRDTDAAGIVHFSVFFAYMEQAEHDFWRSLGTSVVHRSSDPANDGTVTSWPRVNAKCDYKIAIKFEQIIQIEVSVKKIGTKSLTFGFIFRRKNEDDSFVVIAEGEITTVCCSITTDRQMSSIEIPSDLRNMLQPFVQND